MAEVTQEFVDRWRSREHVGVAKPEAQVFMRKGRFVRQYRPFSFLDGSTDPNIVNFNRGNQKYRGHKPRFPWSSYWTPSTDYMEMPTVNDIDTTRDFSGKGVKVATIQLENVFYQALAGTLGTYHMWVRGYFAPWRGLHPKHRPKFSWEQLNDWAEMLTGERQITVYEGYGDQLSKTFTGLVDDVDMTSNPDHITITARDFGGPCLVDQRVVGQNKDPVLRPPITFVDRRHNEKHIPECRHPRASSHMEGHRARGILKGYDWISAAKPNADNTEWIEIHVPAGRYESFFVDPTWGGMEAWISVFCKGHYKTKHNGLEVDYTPPKVDGVAVDEGWYDDGHGTVPGWADGGHPFVRHYNRIDAGGHKGSLGHMFHLGAGSKVRISFRRLHRTQMAAAQANTDFEQGVGDRFRAGVHQFVAYRAVVKKDAREGHWILVDDAADVIKVILRWAGFREWQVESMGARIPKNKPWVFHWTDHYMDIIDFVLQQGNYVFFMDDPTSHDESIGVPVFRHQNAIGKRPKKVLQIRDRDLLTGINVKESATPKATIIRVRGRQAKLKERGHRFGPLGEDRTRRIHATYEPPWNKHHEQAAIMRHALHTDPLLETTEDCKVMCVLIAIQEALAAHTGSAECPGYPGISLDSQVAVIDEGTGTNTRLYITSLGSKFTRGEQASYKTTFGGAFLDNRDLLELEHDFKKALRAQKHRKQQVHIGTAVHVSGSVTTGSGQDALTPAELQGLAAERDQAEISGVFTS